MHHPIREKNNKRKQWFQRKDVETKKLERQEKKLEKLNEKEQKKKQLLAIETPKVTTCNYNKNFEEEIRYSNPTETQDLIGVGAYSKVYKTNLPLPNIYDSTHCARKLTPLFNFSAANKLVVFQTTIRDIAALSKLSGTYSPQFYSITKQPEYNADININMECCDMNLTQYSKTLSYIERIRLVPNILFQLVSSAYNMSLNGIYHCDIKPANVLINNKREIKEVKITDYGLTKFLFNFCHTQLTESTFAYTPPENATNKYVFKANSMLWSIACTISTFLFKDSMYIIELLLSQAAIDNADSICKINSANLNQDSLNKLLYVIFSTIKEKNITKVDLTNSFFQDLPKYLGDYGNSIVKLLEKMLYINCYERISLEDAYKSSVFDRFKKIYPEVFIPYKNNLYVKCWKNKQVNLNYTMRFYVNSWLFRIASLLGENQVDTDKTTNKDIGILGLLPLSVVLSDKYLDVVPNIEEKNYKLLALSCLIIVSSIYDNYGYSINDYVFLVGHIYSELDFVEMIKSIIEKLKGDLYYHTFEHEINDGYGYLSLFGNNMEIFCNKLEKVLCNIHPPYNNKKLITYFNSA